MNFIGGIQITIAGRFFFLFFLVVNSNTVNFNRVGMISKTSLGQKELRSQAFPISNWGQNSIGEVPKETKINLKFRTSDSLCPGDHSLTEKSEQKLKNVIFHAPRHEHESTASN